MRVVRFILRFFGWLLTPIVAWAASFFGATAAAWASRSMAPKTSLLVSTGAGAVTAALVLLLWLRLLRRSPKLRETLEVAPDGTPVAVLDDDQTNGGGG